MKSTDVDVRSLFTEERDMLLKLKEFVEGLSSQRQQPYDRNCGLCRQIDIFIKDYYGEGSAYKQASRVITYLLAERANEWEHYSGNMNHPVGVESALTSPVILYSRYLNKWECPDKFPNSVHSLYVQNRYEYCGWVTRILEEELTE